MGHHSSLSRREILGSIATVGSGTLLLPLRMAGGQGSGAPASGVMRGTVRDGATGKPVAAKIRVTGPTGELYWPVSAIRTMPKSPSRRYFYVRGSFEIAVPPGTYAVEAVRGICHDVVTDYVTVDPGSVRAFDLKVPVLLDLRRLGWYSGNTHTHYALEIEEQPDDRLRMVPPAEALDVSVLSYALRRRLPYPSNRFPIGRLPGFAREGTLVDMGQETRNDGGTTRHGYGHCLFVNLPRLVEPVSTGVLADDEAPDFPTVSMLCAEARRIGGTTIWCHNGLGLESPVAVALGHVDAFNVADGLNANYERYYRLVNCGFHLALSTGTDWWIYDHNRVFVQIDGDFTYEAWIAGLRKGRTFVFNGPLVTLTVNGEGPGATLHASAPVKVSARALSRVPFDRLEIVRDGQVIADQPARIPVERSERRRPGVDVLDPPSISIREAAMDIEIPMERSGWLAARVTGGAKTHAGYPAFAHASPVYVKVEGTAARRAEDAGAFVDELEESSRLIHKRCKFRSDADKAVALGRFEEGRSLFARLVK